MPMTKDRHAHLELLDDPHMAQIERTHQWAAKAAADVAKQRARDLKRSMRAHSEFDAAPSQAWLAKVWRKLVAFL